MDVHRILIADGSEVFREELQERLQGFTLTQTCGDGAQTLELLRSFCPDLLVLDLMLPGMDGISLLQAARSAGIETKVLATTRFCSEYVLEAAQRLGVCYIMPKPCDLRALVSRIEDLLCRNHRNLFVQPDLQLQVTNMLQALGVPPKLSGYVQLREAIILMSRKPGQAMTKELYPSVGAAFGLGGELVERTMRSAVKTAWMNGDPRVWQMYFGNIQHKPTNAEFICRLADCLNLTCRRERA